MKKQNRNNPWAGLASYEDPAKSERKLKFCGRDNDIYDVTHLIDDNLLLILYGKSGIGKTSLLNAGVFPQLRLEQYLPISIRLGTLETSSPYQEAVISAVENAVEEIHGEVSVFNVVEEQTDNQLSSRLWNYFARHRFANPKGQPLFPVVVLDQFEEILRNTTPEHVSKAQTLLYQLQYLVDENHALSDCIVDGHEYYYDFNYRFVISIREDELYLLEDNIDDLSLSMFRNCRYRLRPMKPEQARQVVLVPGKDCIEEKEKEKVTDRIIELSKGNNKEVIDTLLLSLVCASTFDKKLKAKLSWSDFEFWGGNPMRVYYQESIKQINAEQVEYIQNNLINKDGSRRRVQMQELKTNLGEAVYELLIKGTRRILTITADGQVELLHDQIAVTIFEDRDAFEERERNWKLMEMQSRFVSEKVKSVAKEDSYLARRLAVEVLPKDLKNPNRPYTPEADVALRYSSYKHNMVLRGHTDWLDSAVFSPDGKRILSISSGIIKVWDAKTGLNTNTIESCFSGADFYGDSDNIIIFPCRTSDQSVEIKNLKTGAITPQSILSDTDFFAIDCLSSPNKEYAIASFNSTYLELWDITKGVLVKTLSGEEKEYFTQKRSIKFSPNGTIIAAGSENQIRIWGVQTDECIILPKEHADTISSIDFSPKGENLVSASWDKTLKIWDVKTHAVLHTLEGHSERVFAVSYSPDGKKIVSGDEDGIIVLWEVDKGYIIRKYEGHSDAIKSVRFSPDGKRIVSASDDKTIRIWDVDETPELHLCYDIIPGWFNPIATSPDNGIIAYAIENSLVLWDSYTKLAVRALCNHAGDIYSIAFSPNGKQIVTASEDKTLLLWDVSTGNIIQSFIGHSAEVRHVAFSPNGERIISTSKDKSIKIWEVESGACVLTKPVSAWMAAFNPKNNQIVYTTRDGKMVFCDPFSWEEVKSIDVTESKFLSFSFSPDGKQIVTSSSRDGVLELWDAETGIHLDTLRDPSVASVDNGHPGVVAYSINGDKIVSVFGVHSISIWDAKTKTLIERDDNFIKYIDNHHKAIYAHDMWHIGWISGIGLSSDGDAIVSASADRFVLTDAANKLLMCVVEKPLFDNLGSVALSPDEKWLAVRNGNLIIIRGFNTGRIHKILIGHTKHINSIAFNAKGNLLVTTSYDKTIRIWSVDSGQEIRRTYRKHKILSSSYFNPVSTCIVYITKFDFGEFFKDQWTSIYNLGCYPQLSLDRKKVIVRRNNDEIELVGHSDAINSALFSFEQEMVVTSSSDNTIIVWDAGNGEMIHILVGHTDSVNYATFSIDGRYVVSASNDHLVKLWDVHTGQLMRTFYGHGERVIWVAISKDNKKIVSISADKSVIIWNAQNGEAARVLKDYVSNEGVSKSRVSAEFSVDGKYIGIHDNDDFSVVSSDNGLPALKPSIHIWNYENDTIVSSFLNHSDTIESIQFSKDGKTFVTASKNGTVKTWDSLTCTLKKTFENEGMVGLKYAMFGAENNTIIAIDEDNVLKVWDVESGTIIRHIDSILGRFCISPNGRYLTSETDGNTIAVRDIETNTRIQTLKKPKYGYDFMAFSPSGNKIILTKYHHIYIWDFPPLQDLIDQTRERFKNCPFSAEEKRMYYLE